MADVNLASLRFDLQINESEFNSQIESVIAKAKEMNTSVSGVLEGLNKVASGKAMSSSKKNEMLLGLRNEIKNITAELSSLEKNHEKMWMSFARNAADEIMFPKTASNLKEQSKRIDELRAKLAQLNEAYNKLGGDRALAQSFKETKKNASDTSIELRQMSEYYKQISSGASSSASAQKRLTVEAEKGSEAMRKQSRLWNEMKNVALMYFSFDGARRLVSNLVRVSAEFEKQRISLRAILQDADGAERIFAQIKELAVKSPFQFKELVTYTKQLSAFSIPMNELYDTTKMLADVSAGLGVGMDRLVLAYGQIRSASFLRGQEVRQLTEAGIPILEELRKQFEEMGEIGITAGDVFDKISARQVTFSMVEKVFKDMTSEGGKFYQMQEVLADTLSGKISNLTDAYQIMFAEIGEKMDGFLRGSVDALRAIAENYEKVGRALIELVAVYGAYRTAVAAANAVDAIRYQLTLANAAFFNGAGTIKNMTAITTALKGLIQNSGAYRTIATLVSKINPYAAAAAGATALIALIINAVSEEKKLEKVQKDVNAVVEDYNKKVDEESIKVEFLLNRMKNLDSTTKEYASLKKELLNNYGQYLSDLDRERLAVGDLADMYDTLTTAIADAQREKSMSEGFSKISEFYTDEYSDAIERLMGNLKALNISTRGAVAQQLSDYLRGEITRADFTQEAADAYSKMVTKSMNNTTKLWGHQFANPEDLKTQISEAESVVEQQTANLADSLNVMYGVVQKNGVEALDGWRKSIKDIADAADGAQISLGLSIDRQTTLSQVISDVKERIKETKQAIADNEGIEEETAETERKRLSYLEDINRILLGKATPDSGAATSKAMETAGEKRAEIIERQVEAYKQLKDMYASLVEYMSEGEAKDAMKTFFPSAEGLIDNDFDSEIERLTGELRALASAGNEVAIKLLDSLGKDKFTNLISSLQAAETATNRYRELMNTWDELVPSSNSLNRIVKEYEKTLKKIEEHRKEALQELVNSYTVTNDENPAEEFVAQSDLIAEKALGASDEAFANARADVEKAIEGIYKKWRDENTEFEHLTDLSLRQLNNVKDIIEGFSVDNLTDEDRTFISRFIPQIEDLNELLAKFKKRDSEAVDDEKKEDDVRAWKQLAKNIVASSKALKEFASASNNYALEQLAETIGVVGGFVQSVADGFMKAGEMGAVVAGVTSIANFVLEAATRAAQLKSELEEIARNQYFEQIDERIAAASGIFGDSWMGKIRALRTEIQGLTSDSKELLEGTMYQWEMYAPDISLIEALKRYADELGMELYDSNGLFNEKTLEAIQKKYSKAFKARGLSDMLTEITEYNEKLKELYEQLEESISSMFDSLGNDIADTLIASLRETGSAVTDLEEVFQGLGDSIFKSMVQSYIIDEVLNKYKDEVKSWWTDETLSEADVANRMKTFAENVKADIELADGRLTAMYEAFMNNNLLSPIEEEEEKTLGGGIKSITEDTANLLASYVNAIRADVAAIRQAVASQANLTTSAPTLAEYLTQIQANTYNTALNTAALLERINSVMTVSDGPALRVFM